jgi:phospholipase C
VGQTRAPAFWIKNLNSIMGRGPATTAVIIMYDDSDGWYDPPMGPIVNPSAAISSNASDEGQLSAAGKCGNGNAIDGRCGYGLPLLVISPFGADNFLDYSVTGQTSPIRPIEENRNLGNGSFDQLSGPIDNMFGFDRDHSDGHGDNGRYMLFLNAQTGQQTSH